MAEAMARTMGGGRIDSLSAGFAATGTIARHTIVTLERLGYPADGLRSKTVDEIPLESVDVIVSLIGQDGLRMLPPTTAARREAWWIRDPYGDDEDVYDAVGRTLEHRVRRLVQDLLHAEET